MKSAEKERLIKSDILIIESQVRHAFNQGYDLGYKEGIKKNKKQPKTGHWIEHEKGFWSWVNKNGERDGWIPDYECSECGSRAWKRETNYCPQCGAKMFEPQETETWNGIHAQITAPKGTFERILNDADDDSDI